MTCAAEISSILRLARACETEGVRTALARLVSVEGSHYRRPGARMLLAEDGRTAGAISAGCLEADLRRRLPGVLEGRETAVLEYDSRIFEDLVWGLGTGCNGLVRVLLSPFDGALREAHEQIALALAAGRSVLIATALAPVPDSSLRTGDVLLLDGNRVAPRESAVFREEIQPAISLLIAGAGPDAVPLARFAASLGWRIAILTERGEELVRERFSGVAAEYAGGLESARAAPLHGRSAAVVMSHNFNDDAAVLGELLGREVPYLGVLGPRERTERLLKACGAPPEARAKIHSPMGLDIGAENAEEIALSIVAEIQSVFGNGSK